MILMCFLSTFKLLLLVTFIQWSTQKTSHHHHSHPQKLHTHQHHQITGCSRQKSTYEIGIHVTVSSVSYVTEGGSIVTRRLELNWHGSQSKKGDVVALYERDPTKVPLSVLNPVVSLNASSYPGGYYMTDIEFPFVLFNLTSLARDPCLGYWAAYITQGEIQSSSCLQIRPFWMQKNNKHLQDQKLSRIMIPGSHDSGCFSPFAGKSTDTLMRYKYAQDEPIFNQLAYGLRYFDFRVGYYPKTTAKYFINHSFFRTDHSLKSILGQVRSFLDATQEIVILDFHLFPVGFSNLNIHKDLVTLIFETLSPYFIPYKDNYTDVTLGELWKKNQRVLVSYNNLKIRKQEPHDILWPGLTRAWGNKQHPEDLKAYFQKVFSKPEPKGLWASMAELTPNSRFIIRHPKTGLRAMADAINRNITRWFRDEFWDKANIVATDYFLGNNIIDVAVETNRVKSLCIKNGKNRTV